MDRDTIVRMAREAGFAVRKFGDKNQVMEGDNYHIQTDEIERFAALVAEQVEATWQNRYLKLMDLMQIREGQPNKPCCLAEREACAKVCENIDEPLDPSAVGNACATAIRARSTTN